MSALRNGFSSSARYSGRGISAGGCGAVRTGRRRHERDAVVAAGQVPPPLVGVHDLVDVQPEVGGGGAQDRRRRAVADAQGADGADDRGPLHRQPAGLAAGSGHDVGEVVAELGQQLVEHVDELGRRRPGRWARPGRRRSSASIRRRTISTADGPKAWSAASLSRSPALGASPSRWATRTSPTWRVSTSIGAAKPVDDDAGALARVGQPRGGRGTARARRRSASSRRALAPRSLAHDVITFSMTTTLRTQICWAGSSGMDTSVRVTRTPSSSSSTR